jgi:hypothetical protein
MTRIVAGVGDLVQRTGDGQAQAVMISGTTGTAYHGLGGKE